MSSAHYHHLGKEDDQPSEALTQGTTTAANLVDTNGVTEDVNWRQRRWTVALFSVSTILLFADQNLMSPNLTAIAHDFGFNEEQRDSKLGGDIALAFFLLGAPASFVVGCLGDTWDRTNLFAWTVGIGEGACLATFFTRNYPQLYVCRAITGFSIGGALPLIYSILGDLFKAEERHVVSALVGIGTGAGIATGQGIAGFLGPTFGWRLPFLVVSIPALVCTAMVRFTVQDPERGGMEQAVQEHRQRQNEPAESSSSSDSSHETLEMAPLDSNRIHAGEPSTLEDIVAVDESPDFNVRGHWAMFRSLLATPTLLLALLQGAPGCLPWGIVNTYLNDFLSENRGMTVEFATLTVLIFGLGNFFGMILGGAGGSYLYRIDVRYPVLFAGCMAILGCIPFWILLNKINASSSLLSIALVSVLAGTTSGATGPIVKATLQNVTLPQARGSAFALFNTFDDFGRGLGPVFVAKLIRRMGDRSPAFNIGVLGWFICGLFNICMFWTVRGDERRMQVRLAVALSDKRSGENGTVGALVIS